VTQHLLRDVDAGDDCAKAGKQPRILTLAAPERQNVLPLDLADQPGESGIDETGTVGSSARL
jgi:hypothetical protein